ncbi:hypothetical protein PENSPDRAFT_250633 [Peniophora sp. CONT]|nr:hypothetical protein PENSPDRAFT_250633 [Peniophora sp. CONT]
MHMRFDVLHQRMIGASTQGGKSGQGAAALRQTPHAPHYGGVCASGLVLWAPAGPETPHTGRFVRSSLPQTCPRTRPSDSCLLSAFLLWQRTPVRATNGQSSPRSSGEVASRLQHASAQCAIRHIRPSLVRYMHPDGPTYARSPHRVSGEYDGRERACRRACCMKHPPWTLGP